MLSAVTMLYNLVYTSLIVPTILLMLVTLESVPGANYTATPL